MYKIVDIVADKIDVFGDDYYIKVNIMSPIGEYSESLSFGTLKTIPWIGDFNEMMDFIMRENQAFRYPGGDSICFNKAENAINVANKLVSLYAYTALEECE